VGEVQVILQELDPPLHLLRRIDVRLDAEFGDDLLLELSHTVNLSDLRAWCGSGTLSRRR
jgi:hypothetical protein